MKKFWVILVLVLFIGFVAGERALLLLMDSASRLRAILPPEQEVGVAVIGKRLDGFVSVLVAVAGEYDGVRKGDRAITRDNEYVGRIDHVSSKASQIVLASRPGERTIGWLPALSVPLELQGWGSGLLRALIPASFPVEIGDDIWYDARFDAFVGSIISIQNTKNNETEARKEIFVRHAVNPLMLSSVEVVP